MANIIPRPITVINRYHFSTPRQLGRDDAPCTTGFARGKLFADRIPGFFSLRMSIVTSQNDDIEHECVENI